MKKRLLLPLLLGAVVFGAIGFGLGFVLGSADSAPETSGQSVETLKDEGEPATSTPVSERDPPAGERSERRPNRPRERGGSGGAAQGLLDQIEIPAIPTGAGVVSGHVKTKEGTPVEGVRIKLTPKQQQPDAAPDTRPYDEIPVEELLERHARTLLWQRASRRTVTTDAEGGYRFESLADTGHSLSAVLEGWQIQPSNWQLAHDAKDGAEVDFVATETIKVEAHMTLPDGTVPETAQLEFKQGGSTSTHGWTPARPFASMPPGKYDVRGLAGSQGEFGSEPQSVELEAGNALPPLVLQLKGRPGLHGKVTFPAGEAPGNVRVYLAPVPAGAAIDEVQLKNSGKQAWAHTPQGMAYQFPDLAPGRYALGVGRSHNGPLAVMEFVTVGEGPVEHDLRVPELDPAEYVLVHALDAQGEPVRQFTVRVSYRSKSRNSSTGGTVLAQPDGSVRVLHQAVQEQDDGRRFLSLTSPQHGTVESEYRKGPASELTIRFAAPGRLVATVQGHEGKRYASMLYVYVSRIVREGDRTRQEGGGGGQIGADGKHVFAALQPGEYRVTLSVGSRNRVTVVTQTVQVASGENSVSLTVPELSAVTVYGATNNVYARRTNGENRISVRGVQGKDKWVLDFLPPGEYEIRSAGNKNQTISVPGTTEVRF